MHPHVPGTPASPRTAGRGRWLLGAGAGLVAVVLGLVLQVAVIVLGTRSAGSVPQVGWLSSLSVLLAGAVAALVAQPLTDPRWRRRVLAAVPGAVLDLVLTAAGAVEGDRRAGVPWTTHLVPLVTGPLLVLLGAGLVALLGHLRRRRAVPTAPGGAVDAD